MHPHVTPIAKSHSLSSSYHRNNPQQQYPETTPLLFPTLPVMDPTGVDFRAFYPYTPNEVKHRKRTTSDQLKTLETIFKRDTKPNAALRTELAAKLDMTPRGVQVWFQNRRAKEKTKASKTTNTQRTGTAPTGVDSTSTDASSSPSEVDVGADAQLPSYVSSAVPQKTVPPSPRPDISVDSSVAQSPWLPSPSPIDQPLFAPVSEANFARRGSLPIDVASHFEHHQHGPPLPGQLDRFSRRLSVDASLQHRFPSSSYIRSRNSNRLSGSLPRHQISRTAGSPYPRPELPHISSAPINGSFHGRHISADTSSVHFSPTGEILPYAAQMHPRPSLPDTHLYALSSRMIGSPIPGPLPSPGFSFGIANTNMASLTPPSSADSERNSPDPIRGYTFQGEDSEDDHASSYDALSRFGSIASISTSETSNGSAYYSDCPIDHEIPPNDSRRGSCTSTQFLGMMSNLDVSGLPGADHHRIEDFTEANTNLGAPVHGHDGSAGNSSYSSPSTISPGSTPSLHNESTSGQKPHLSGSSELAFALQSSADQSGTQAPFAESSSVAHDSQGSSSLPESPYMYLPDPTYAHPVRSTENPHPDQFQYENAELPQDSANYYPEAYSSFAPHSDGNNMNHYGQPSNLFGQYDAAENAPHNDFAVYS